MEDHSLTDYSLKDWVEEGDIPVRCLLYSFDLWLTFFCFFLSFFVYLLYFIPFFLFFFPFFPPSPSFSFPFTRLYEEVLSRTIIPSLRNRDLSDALRTQVLCGKYSVTFLWSFLFFSPSCSPFFIVLSFFVEMSVHVRERYGGDCRLTEYWMMGDCLVILWATVLVMGSVWLFLEK